MQKCAFSRNVGIADLISARRVRFPEARARALYIHVHDAARAVRARGRELAGSHHTQRSALPYKALGGCAAHTRYSAVLEPADAHSQSEREGN